MERIDRILHNSVFQEHVAKNQAAEADRCFCRHDMEHFLAVARIGMILNLEDKLGFPRELIYAAALLHDLGRHRQYEEGIPHEEAGAEIAQEIMKQCGFSVWETKAIADAITHHRNGKNGGRPDLGGLLFRADKLSRSCFCCEVAKECNWKQEKKNLSIRY